MKCKLNSRIKYEIQIAVLMTSFLIFIIMATFGLSYIIGYISVHPFNIDFMFLDVNNDIEYYTAAGLMIMFTSVVILIIIFILKTITQNIIWIIKNPKDFYNSIFICENKDDN